VINSISSVIYSQIASAITLKQAILESEKISNQIQAIVRGCELALRSGGKIIFAGNGGSFADSQHLAAEFISRFMFDREPLAAIVLGANNSVISAIGNDYGYEQVFTRELIGLAKPNDFFIPISTSGNSANIISAAIVAKELGLPTMALVGSTGGKLSSICECLNVPSKETARIQECHIMIGHIVCELVEDLMFNNRAN